MTTCAFVLAVLVALTTCACGNGGDSSSAVAEGPWSVTVERLDIYSRNVESCSEYSVPDEQWAIPIEAPWTGLYVTAPGVDALGREVREIWLPENPVATVTVRCGAEPAERETLLTSGEKVHRVTLGCDPWTQ